MMVFSANEDNLTSSNTQGSSATTGETSSAVTGEATSADATLEPELFKFTIQFIC